MATATFVDAALAAMAPMWVELSFLLFFALGFAFLRIDVLLRKTPSGKQKTIEDPQAKTFDARIKKSIEAEAAAGNPEAVLSNWRAGKAGAAAPPELLRMVVQAFLDAAPGQLLTEVVEHLRMHAATLANPRTAAVVLDVVARAGNVQLMTELWKTMQTSLDIPASYQTYEVMLGGFASVGQESKVFELLSDMKLSRLKLTARGFSLIIKGFLKNGMVDAVFKQLLEMRHSGHHVPPFAVTQFFRIACEAGRSAEMFDTIATKIALSPEAVMQLLEDCARRQDLDFARRVEKFARDSKVAFLCGSFDSLLKLYTVSGDLHALELFQEMQSSGLRISEGLCVGLLARCAETKFLRFAEDIVKFTRAREGMSIAVYSALMKVYAYCGMYDKACDLYDRIIEDGLEPDGMMYGCLMKFAVECGRTKLSQELAEKAPTLDIQNYMSLIRAAGRDRDTDRAFAVLQKLRNSGVSLDIAAYNCVLDVCVSAGDMRRARQLTNEMRTFGTLDVITYNTLLKGYCSMGNLQGARALLTEMKEAGIPPNDVSYNCLINAAVSTGNGNFQEAWDIIEMMERNGIAVDHYTISIMMKALKKAKNPKDVQRSLALLDRTGLDVCSDEIMLNTVLETCIRHRECRRLDTILTSYAKSGLRPSVHTYGSLIKACSTLKRLDQCWELWREMEEKRGVTPNDIVLGCMLDALVCNSRIEEAVSLLEQWRERVPPNTVMYSTIIKGFANSHQYERAMQTWRQMRTAGITMNTVVYNAVIDAQARVGAMQEVSELVETMATDGCHPDVITYSTIVKGYCVKGDLDKAFEVFRSMQRNSMAGDSIIYNTVLDGCTRHGRMDLADQLLEDMEKYNVVPSNFTLGIMVKMYGRRRQLDKAFEIVQTLPRRHNFAANAQVRTCLMCACLNNNAVDRAFEVFEDMKTASQGADAKAYGALISGCVRHGHLDRAMRLVEDIYGLSGCTPLHKVDPSQVLEPEPLENLLRALSQRGLMETQGVPLLERLRAAKAPINGRLYSTVLGGPMPPAGGDRRNSRRSSGGSNIGSGGPGGFRANNRQ